MIFQLSQRPAPEQRARKQALPGKLGDNAKLALPAGVSADFQILDKYFFTLQVMEDFLV